MTTRPRLAHPLVTFGLVLFAGFTMAAGAAGVALVRLTAPSAPEITARPTPNLLVAVRDLARLESLEMHFEKVVDVNDKQRRLFGLVETEDGILVVAAVDVTLGVDLTKLRDGDVTGPDAAGTAHICLPEPEILSSRLDEPNTYVYQRSTGLLAKRNEQLEAEARRTAIGEVEKAVRAGDAMARARTQAERTLRSLAGELGVHAVEFSCP